ncbi:MAG TPA: DUF3276 family protein [Williamwhitmania sp.]|nr:DUF3276 family protein [Williamwhitmania sp.]
MTDDFDKHDGYDREENSEIFSKAVRAGKRTYFFDVKATRGDDYYLTITESKKKVGRDGRFFYDKHKIFLYKEDFEKFAEGLHEVVEYIHTTQGKAEPYRAESFEEEKDELVTNNLPNGFSNVDFEDLDEK